MFPFSSESNSSHLGFWRGLKRFERIISIFRFINLAQMTTSTSREVNHFEAYAAIQNHSRAVTGTIQPSITCAHAPIFRAFPHIPESLVT